MVDPVGEMQPIKPIQSPLPRREVRLAGEQGRETDILHDRQGWEKIERLKDHAHRGPTVFVELFGVSSLQIVTIDGQSAPGRLVQTPQKCEERALSGSADTLQNNQLALRYFQIYILDTNDLGRSERVDAS